MLKLVNKHRSEGSDDKVGGLLAVNKSLSGKISKEVIIQCSFPWNMTVLSRSTLITAAKSISLTIVTRFNKNSILHSADTDNNNLIDNLLT